MKIYKIPTHDIPEYLKFFSRLIKILCGCSLGTMLLAYWFIFIPIIMEFLRDFHEGYFVWVIIFLISIPFLFGGIFTIAVLINGLKYNRFMAEAIVFRLDDSMITREIDLDSEQRMSRLIWYWYRRSKLIAPFQWSLSLPLEKIAVVKEKKRHLVICTSLNPFDAPHTMLIPKQIERYEELKLVLLERVKKNNNFNKN